MKRIRVATMVVLLVVALTATAAGQGTQLDISGGFNLDVWCGPTEFQALLAHPGYHLTDMQGGLAEGVGMWIVGRDQFLISNTTAAPGFDQPYSIASTAGHPVWKQGTQGTPEDGVLPGADRTYHMASVLGNATLAGDWTEEAGAPYYGMEPLPNTMCVMTPHSTYEFQVAQVTAELPAGQKGRYNNINFVLAAANMAHLARYMRIYALYGADGSDEQLLYRFEDAVADGPRIIDNDGGADFRIVYTFDEVYMISDDPGSEAGLFVEQQGSLYEFAEPLDLDPNKILWGVRLADDRPGTTGQARGLAVFAATAYPWSEVGPFDPDGAITGFAWTRGSEQIATGPTPEVTLAVGSHRIVLEVTDNDGWTDSDDLWVLVRAEGCTSKARPLDISAGFNVDSWFGPKEDQALLWYDEGPSTGKDLQEAQGFLRDGVGWYVHERSLMMIGNVSEGGLGEPYSIYSSWYHPSFKSGTQGTPEDGYIAGVGQDYFIASTRGNPILTGDWLEVDEPVVPASSGLMDNRPNSIVVGPSVNGSSWWLDEVVAELPPHQRARYESINVVLVAMNDSSGADGIQLLVVYSDNSEEVLWTFDATTPTAVENRADHPDFNLIWTFDEIYNALSGPVGNVTTEAPGSLYEFAAPLPLDPNKLLKAVKIVDPASPDGYNNGLAVFAATAILPPTPELSVRAAQFDTVNNLMYFDLVLLNSDGRTDMIQGFGASATLSGADAGHFTAAPDEVRNKLGMEMDAMVDPAPYAWTTFLFPVVANSTAPEMMAFGQNAWFPGEHVALDSLAEGTVVARFYYEWDGVEVSKVCVSIESYAQIDPGPVFTTRAGDVVLGTVLNDGTNIAAPEAGDPAISVSLQDDLDWVYQNTPLSLENLGHMVPLTVTVTDLNGNGSVVVSVDKVPGSGPGEVTFLNDPDGDPMVRYVLGSLRSDGSGALRFG